MAKGKIELLDDDGTYQSVFIPEGEDFLPTGYGRYLDYARDKKGWNLKRWIDYVGDLKVASTAHPTHPTSSPAVMVTTLEVFPRKNKWGDVAP